MPWHLWQTQSWVRTAAECILWGALGILLGACTPATIAPSAPVTIRIAGSTAATPALRDLTDAYSRHHPNVAFDLRGGGSTLGEEWIAAGEYDMVVSTLFAENSNSNPATEAQPPIALDGEAENAAMPLGTNITPSATLSPQRPPQISLIRSLIALDGLAIVVHPANKVESLTPLQLRDLYSGHLLNWREVGGRDEDVLLVSREDGSGARALFEARVMGGESVSLTAVVMPTHADVVQYVAAHPQAVGYVSRGYVSNILTGADDDPSVHILAVDGVYPMIENLRDQSYAFVYPLHLIIRRESSPQVRRFLEFVLSPPGQEIISRYYAPIR